MNRIGIVLSTYNGEKYLKEQLDSIFKQSYTNWIIYIRDDCSVDGTVLIINDYILKAPEKIIMIDNDGCNLGSSNSFFTLLKYVNTDLIIFCDQDDVWNDNKLQILNDYYNRNCQDLKIPILIHTGAEIVDVQLKLLKRLTENFNKNKFGMEKSFIWQVFQNDVTGCTMLINDKMKILLDSVNICDYKIIQHDWILAQIAYLYNSKFYIPAMTIKYRQHDDNVIGTKKLSLYKKIILKKSKGISYKYYDQIKAILAIKCPIEKELNKQLIEFTTLKNKTKLYRIYWHIHNGFIRDGKLFIKLYQLLIC